MTYEEWIARYQNIMQDIANSNSMAERVQKANYYKYELDTMRDSQLPVDNDLAALKIAYDSNGGAYEVPGNSIQVQNANTVPAPQVQYNQSNSYQPAPTYHNNVNTQPAYAAPNTSPAPAAPTSSKSLAEQLADWRSQYDTIMQDIAKSKSMEERQQKTNQYSHQLALMKDSKLPVDNDLEALNIRIVNGQADIIKPETEKSIWSQIIEHTPVNFDPSKSNGEAVVNRNSQSTSVNFNDLNLQDNSMANVDKVQQAYQNANNAGQLPKVEIPPINNTVIMGEKQDVNEIINQANDRFSPSATNTDLNAINYSDNSMANTDNFEKVVENVLVSYLKLKFRNITLQWEIPKKLKIL